MYPFFVYGTLRTEGHNYKFIENFVSHCQPAALPNFLLYSMGLFPMAFKGQGEVIGEVFWVSSQNHNHVLQQLDQLEEHPHVYRRELHVVRLPENQLIKAWAYVAPPDRSAETLLLIPSGDWFNR